MSIKKLFLAAPLALAPLFAVACDHPAYPPAQTTSGVQLVSQTPSEKDIETISAERCTREARCGNVGQGLSYQTRAACMQDVGKDNRSELTNGPCPHGILGDKLEKCLSEVRSQRCDNPFDTLSRINACARPALCVE